MFGRLQEFRKQPRNAHTYTASTTLSLLRLAAVDNRRQRCRLRRPARAPLLGRFRADNRLDGERKGQRAATSHSFYSRIPLSRLPEPASALQYPQLEPCHGVLYSILISSPQSGKRTRIRKSSSSEFHGTNVRVLRTLWNRALQLPQQREQSNQGQPKLKYPIKSGTCAPRTGTPKQKLERPQTQT